jgi:amidase
VKKSPLIHRLEEAGAYVLAKTNLSEWAFYMSTDGVCGYSSVGGQTMHATGFYEAGGSSTGTAVALALGLAPLGIGTETNGSILYPAGQNGVVGFYPARGTWPTQGILPISHHLDTPGPMARYLSDARSFAEVIAGPFREMSGTKIVVFDPPSRKWGRGSDPELIERAASQLKDMGLSIERKAFPDSAHSIALSPVLEGDFAADVDAFLKEEIAGTVDFDFRSLVRAYRSDPDRLAPYGMDLLEKALEPALTGEEVSRLAKAMADRARILLDEILADGGVCLGINSQLSNLYAACGYPSLVVPGGHRADGEPYGIALTARPGEEDRLFRVAALLERP